MLVVPQEHTVAVVRVNFFIAFCVVLHCSWNSFSFDHCVLGMPRTWESEHGGKNLRRLQVGTELERSLSSVSCLEQDEL